MAPLSNTLAQARARQALRASGLPHDGELTHASSTRNEVFLSDRHVVRVNRQPTQRLRREAQLCQALPNAPWAPTIVAYGGEVGGDYLIVERHPGAPLSRSWPDMGSSQRVSAIAQLADILRSVHATPKPAGVAFIDSPPQMLSPANLGNPISPLYTGLDRLAKLPTTDPDLVAVAKDKLGKAASAIDDHSADFLIHGDVTFENVLWDGKQVTALVDFEWCREGPADLDLDVLLRFFAIPHGHVAEDYVERTRPQDYLQAPQWLADAYPELFGHASLADRLWIYALAFEVRDTLANPPPANRRSISDLHPYHRFMNLVSTGGHVDEFLSRLSLPQSSQSPSNF